MQGYAPDRFSHSFNALNALFNSAAPMAEAGSRVSPPGHRCHLSPCGFSMIASMNTLKLLSNHGDSAN